jgi:hypothetical protein
MTTRFATSACVLLAAAVSAAFARAEARLAERPPMGWNSWNSFGVTVNEAQVKANADYMAKHLKRFGWEYVVVDLGWYLPPEIGTPGFKIPRPPQEMDAYGRLVPDPRKFPSAANGRGFEPLADYVHGLGLKFGVHIMRGVPSASCASAPTTTSQSRWGSASRTSRTSTRASPRPRSARC